VTILTTVTGPAIEPISSIEAREHSYITSPSGEEDVLIARQISAARAEFERITSAALITQTVEERFYAWPADGVMVLAGRSPLQSVTSIKYTDSDGTENTMLTDDYVVDSFSQPGKIWLGYSASWPSATLQPGPSIVVRYVAGFGDDAEDVPADIRNALLLIFGELYEHRERTIIQSGLSTATVNFVAQTMRNVRRT
jgi:uncharacterized phiE125 gp8 family phage protein